MNDHSFSISEALSFGFRMFVRNFWLLLGLSLVGALVQFGAGAISKMVIERSGLSACRTLNQAQPLQGTLIAESDDFITITSNKVSGAVNDLKECFTSKNIALTMLLLLIQILAAIFAFVLFMGWNRIALDLYDHGTSEFSRIFVTFPLFLSYFIAGFLYTCVVGIGLILLVIPGIVWGIKYSFFDLMIIDTGCGPVDALSRSGELTYGHKWKLLLFAIICFALMAISVVTIVGPFILAYVFFLSRAYIFRMLQGKRQHA